MNDRQESPNISAVRSDLNDLVHKIRARTPARLLAGRAGSSYRTQTQMELREAHAAARDAVRAELEPMAAFGAAFVQEWRLFETYTRAASKHEYLLRPDLGRHFEDNSRAEIQKRCLKGSDLQISIGDGLSVPAVSIQIPALLPLLGAGARGRGWQLGQTFIIHHCRVGILNEIGEMLEPRVALLLIGERPGLATAESLSAYMSYRPGNQHTDADRNLISNIHSRGVAPADAVARILNLAARMIKAGGSGYSVKEEASWSSEELR
ncbi:MAG: ethanolamine ammonia-lyase subunit EutC [Candidatus Acidiferrales bacterium]